MWLGFDIGLGPFADVPLARWQEAFVPMRLADSLREATGTDGRPLVASEQRLLPHRIAPEPAGVRAAAGGRGCCRASPRRWRCSCSAGARRACWRRSRCRSGRSAALLGLLMLFIWFGTAHRAGWANQNLLLFNPLCLLLLPGGWRAAARPRRQAR